MQIRCLTNNPTIIKKGVPVVEAFDVSPLDLFKLVRSEVLKGYKLITHPLTGSIGLDLNPYKSVILSSDSGNVNIDSLEFIQKSISYTKNLMANNSPLKWDYLSLRDFQLIDLDLIDRFLL